MPDENGARYRIGVDVGGTFTDLVMIDDRSGRIHTAKTKTTRDVADGLVHGIQSLMSSTGGAPESVSQILFASTVATNAVVQLRGGRIGLIVTKGFRHILEIARGNIPGRMTSELTYIRPARLVPLELVHEVDERCLPDGSVLTGLSDESVRAAIMALASQGVECVAVALLHSYANPTHEQRIGAMFRDLAPDILVTLSSAVIPEYREYERTMTTVLNAFVMPAMGKTVEGVRNRLAEMRLEPSLRVVRSDGGVMSTAVAIQRPLDTVVAGPAGGVNAASYIAEMAGYRNVISLDMGGTSTDVSLLAGGSMRVRAETMIGDYPAKVPIVDVVTIGAGGGSIAYQSSTGALHVGPMSAGANPGPVCYDQGGQQVTVTDANVFLGRLPPYLLGGEISLSVDRAREAIEALAERVGMTPVDLAAGILSIANAKMLGAMRVVSVERGYDPRDFVLLAFGGAGPMHAAELCRLLGIHRAIIPPLPGVLSALGTLVADYRRVFSETHVQKVAGLDLPQANATYRKLAEAADAWLAEEGLPQPVRSLEFHADLRYVGQASEVMVPSVDRFTSENIAGVVDGFHAEHRRLYGFDWRDTVPVELVALKVTAVGRVARPPAPAAGASTQGRPEPLSVRSVFFDGRFVDTPCYQRSVVGPGAELRGPAIIDQHDCTTVVLPGQRVTVDPFNNLLISEE